MPSPSPDSSARATRGTARRFYRKTQFARPQGRARARRPPRRRHRRRSQREDDDAGGRRGRIRSGAGADEATRVRDKSNKLKRAEELNAQPASADPILTEEEFCRLAGVPTPDALKRQYHALRDVLARYRALREDHLRYS